MFFALIKHLGFICLEGKSKALSEKKLMLYSQLLKI